MLNTTPRSDDSASLLSENAIAVIVVGILLLTVFGISIFRRFWRHKKTNDQPHKDRTLQKQGDVELDSHRIRSVSEE